MVKGIAEKIDQLEQRVILANGVIIPIDDIVNIEVADDGELHG